MFKEGDKVRCIDAGSTWEGVAQLKVGEIYTVEKVKNFNLFLAEVYLVEFKQRREGDRVWWWATRFELVKEQEEKEMKEIFEKGDLVEVVATCSDGPSIGTRLLVTKTPDRQNECDYLDVENWEGANSYVQNRYKIVKKANAKIVPAVKYIHIRLDETTSKGGGITIAFVEDEHYVTFGVTSAAPNVPYNKKLGREAALKAFTESPQRLNLNTLRAAKGLEFKVNGRRADAVVLLKAMFEPSFTLFNWE